MFSFFLTFLFPVLTKYSFSYFSAHNAFFSQVSAEYLPLLTVPDDAKIDTSQGGGVELELADADTLEWERLMIQTVLEIGVEEGLEMEMGEQEGLEMEMGEDGVLEMKYREEERDMEILISAGRSYGDISAGAISSDLILLFGGEDMTNTKHYLTLDIIFRLPHDVCLHSADAWQSQFC